MALQYRAVRAAGQSYWLIQTQDTLANTVTTDNANTYTSQDSANTAINLILHPPFHSPGLADQGANGPWQS